MSKLSEKLKKSAFNGVPINIKSIGRNGGKRLAVHEFAGSDEPSFDELGLKAKTIQVSFSVVGEDWIELQKQLLIELDKPGTSTFDDPILGSTPVYVDTVSVCEDLTTLGEALFDVGLSVAKPTKLAFVAPSPKEPKEIVTEKAEVAAAGELAAGGWSPMTAFDDACACVEAVISSMQDSMQTLQSSVGKLQKLEFLLRRIKGAIKDKVMFPQKLAEALNAIVSGLVDALEKPILVVHIKPQIFSSSASEGQKTTLPPTLQAKIVELKQYQDEKERTNLQLTVLGKLAAIKETLDTIPLPVGVLESEKQAATRNREALAAAVEALVLPRLAEAVASGAFASEPAAAASKQAVVALIDRCIERVSRQNDPVMAIYRYEELVTLRTQVISARQNIPKIAGKTIPTNTIDTREEALLARKAIPSLAACYDAYGHMEFYADFVERNEVKNPLEKVTSLMRFADGC